MYTCVCIRAHIHIHYLDTHEQSAARSSGAAAFKSPRGRPDNAPGSDCCIVDIKINHHTYYIF